ncbi:MAG: UDP-N-acetylmuramate dehydrogenase [Campylobacteraceae bacterium]|jgi:UDP-N-acetylmuramate dehydrogenase|nr:UDP-N-acetylmuramate dehydrogenase [Campylobacteraceae bacterium]
MSYKEIDFSKYSSIKIGGRVKTLVIDELMPIEKGVFIVGGANNLLISPNPPPLAILSSRFDFIKEEGDVLRVGAGVGGGRLLSYAKKHDIAGFELLQKLPGKLGGIVKMNAGLKEFCISDNLLGIITEEGEKSRQDINFSYRNSDIKGVIYEVLFEKKSGFDEKKLAAFKEMRKNQPKEPSAGSCFKNPPNDYAGRLLELAGFKGKREGNMAFSDVHANFLINLGGGTFEEAITLIKAAQKAVFEHFGIELELEIKIV